jgi:hypothetical protein
VPIIQHTANFWGLLIAPTPVQWKFWDYSKGMGNEFISAVGESIGDRHSAVPPSSCKLNYDRSIPNKPKQTEEGF